MRADSYRCVFHSERPADHLHHVTGRDADGDYLDPLLVVPLAHRQHVVEHQAWNVAGIGDGAAGSNVLRLRRVGHLLVRMGEHHGIGFVVLPASFVRQMGLMLHRVADDHGPS
jgi:hypothetical protein